MLVAIRITREPYGARVDAEVKGQEGDDVGAVIKAAREMDAVARELTKKPDEPKPSE